MRADKEVLGIVDILVWPILNTLDDLGHELYSISPSPHPGKWQRLDSSNIHVVPNLSVSLEVCTVYHHSVFTSQQSFSRLIGQDYLIKEYILPISTLGCKVLQVAILANPMLQAQLLPELAANYCSVIHHFSNETPHRDAFWDLAPTAVAALAGLNRDNLSANLSHRPFKRAAG